MSIYQGPVIIDSCFFDKYVTKSWCVDDKKATKCDDANLITRYAGAISFKRSNQYPSMTSSYVQNNTFGFCDNVSGVLPGVHVRGVYVDGVYVCDVHVDGVYAGDVYVCGVHVDGV